MTASRSDRRSNRRADRGSNRRSNLRSSRSSGANPALAGLLAGAVALGSSAALAQSENEIDQLPDRLDRFVEGFMDRVRPAIDDLFGLLQVMDRIDSPSHYGKPVILPNGDILIPRAPDAPAWEPGEDPEPDFAPPIGSPLEDDGSGQRT